MEEQLGAIQPEEVAEWLYINAFGLQNPGLYNNPKLECS